MPMNTPDLTKHPPRSPRVRLGGYVILPRMLDKGRATTAGKNGEYKYACPLDERFLDFAGIDPEALKKQLAAGNLAQILERIKPSRMAVAPNWLDRVPANGGDAPQLKCRRRQRSVRIPVNLAHDVHLSLAPGTGTASAQRFQPHKAFTAIIPFDGQVLAHLLNVRRSHGSSVIRSHSGSPQITR